MVIDGLPPTRESFRAGSREVILYGQSVDGFIVTDGGASAGPFLRFIRIDHDACTAVEGEIGQSPDCTRKALWDWVRQSPDSQGHVLKASFEPIARRITCRVCKTALVDSFGSACWPCSPVRRFALWLGVAGITAGFMWGVYLLLGLVAS